MLVRSIPFLLLAGLFVPAALAQDPASIDSAAAPELTPRAEVPVISIVGDEEDVAQLPGSAHVVDESRLQETEYDDIHRVLQEVPGVYVREEDSFGLRPNIGIRGASSDRSAKVTLMEDGILFAPAPYAAPAAYYFPLTTRMTAVEVFKGPASIQYGPHTIGGALNLVTRPIPEVPEAMVDISLGARETWKTHGWAGTRWRDSGVLIEYVHLESDGFKDLDGGDDTGFSRNEVMLKADHRWSLAGLDMVSAVKVGFSDELSNETYLGLSDDDFERKPYRRYAASQRDRMDWERWQVELSQEIAVNDQLSFFVTGYRHDLDRSWRKLNRFEDGAPDLQDVFANSTGRNAVYLSVLRGDSDSTTPLETLLIGTNAREFVSQGVQLTGSWTPQTGPLEHAIDIGLRVHYDEVVRDHTEEPYRMINRTVVRTTDPIRQIGDNSGEALAVATYLRDEVSWRFLTLTPGIRFESIHTDYRDRLPELTGGEERKDSDVQNVVIPGVGAVIALPYDFSLLGGVHRGFSPVAPGQSSEADPEESINSEVGARYLGELVRGEVIGFYNAYDNILATCRQGSGCDPEDVDRQFNGGNADIYGVEVRADTEPEIGWQVRLPATLSYTFTQTEFLGDFRSASPIFGEVEAGDEIPYVPEHQLSLSLGIVRGWLGMSTILNYVGEMRDVAGQGPIPEPERVEDHFVADLFAHWDFNERGRLYLGLENIADAEYIVSRRPFGARPGKPFHVYGGIKYRFGG
ncbi:MAG TPA: TonB-dependent receptor [Terriglobales bacterium]|nr:TonB-dependent receptor [Terriglobales bacterium]